jgi:hypothetical protein
MKYLKKFNEELKSTTYKSAATQLQYQHPSKAKTLSEFGDVRHKEEQEEVKRIELEKDRIRKEKEYKEWQDDIERYSPFGLFTFTINPDGGDSFNDDFYLKVTHWYDEDHYGEIKPNTITYLNLDFFLIPKDIETYEKVRSCGDWDWQDGYTFHIWRGYINIDLKEDFCTVNSFVTDTADNFSGEIEIADRKTALKFKRLMVGIFSNKEYPDYVASYHETHKSLYNAFEATLAESGISSDYGLEMSNIAENINKISVNTLYKSN